MDGRIATPVVSAHASGVDLYAAVGGAATCRALAATFYARVAQDPLLRPFFPGKTHTCAIEAFAAFLTQFLGGPPEAAQRRQWLSLRDSHRRFAIGRQEQEAWLRQMDTALEAVPIDEPARQALRRFFAASSAYLINQEPALPRAVDSNTHIHDVDQALGERWEVQRRLDAAVAAVRAGQAGRAISVLQSPVLQPYLLRDHAVWARLLAVMIDSGDADLLAYVQATLIASPVLIPERFSGHTLLHVAAAAGDIRLMALLLQRGADPNDTDLDGHAPLYYVANARTGAGGALVVRALVEAGATVNAAGGITRCTALHMAARRGNAAVAAALLDAGADIEASDRRGDTPLRRAVNCGQTMVAAFLLARGADRRAPGSQGLKLAYPFPQVPPVFVHSGSRNTIFGARPLGEG